MMNRKSPCQELEVSAKKTIPRKVARSKKHEETNLDEDSDDERECFINIRKKKLDLMRKNSLQEESSSSGNVSPSSSSTCSSRDAQYRRAESSHSHPVSSPVSQSDTNLQEEAEEPKKPRLRLRLRR